MKIVILLLIIGMSNGQVSTDWTAGLQAQIDQLTSNIGRNVEQLTSNINRNVNQVQEQVQENVRRINEDISKRVGKINDGDVTTIGGGSSIILNTNGHGSIIRNQGTSSNGEPYFIETENRIVDGIEHRTVRVYNPKRKEFESTHYTRDIKDPNAEFVRVSATNKE